MKNSDTDFPLKDWYKANQFVVKDLLPLIVWENFYNVILSKYYFAKQLTSKFSTQPHYIFPMHMHSHTLLKVFKGIPELSTSILLHFQVTIIHIMPANILQF